MQQSAYLGMCNLPVGVISTNKTKGFTVVELMIAVAIIGILTSIAIPAYQDYLIRSKISEAMIFIGSAKLAVSEYYDQNHSWPTSLAQAGIISESSLSGRYVESISIGESGIMSVKVNYGSGNGTIIVTPTSPD